MMRLVNDDQAADILLEGGVGVLATDTIYGIVARAADPKAVARLYALKDRDHKPGTVIAANVEQLVALGVEEQYLRHVEQWWPASLSVETPLGEHLAYLHQDMGRQGFRVVDDERLRSLLLKTGPLVTSSANLPGQDPSNTIEDAFGYFGAKVDFYVDSGDHSGRPPSTIARITSRGIEIIRQGAVTIPSEHLVPPAPADCPFCLSNNLFKANIYAENETALLADAYGSEGNYLVIPKAHIETVTDLPDLWWRDIKTLFQKLPERPGSFNITMNYGKLAGQSISHLHFWIVPRVSDTPASGKGLAGLMTLVNDK